MGAEHLCADPTAGGFEGCVITRRHGPPRCKQACLFQVVRHEPVTLLPIREIHPVYKVAPKCSKGGVVVIIHWLLHLSRTLSQPNLTITYPTKPYLKPSFVTLRYGTLRYATLLYSTFKVRDRTLYTLYVSIYLVRKHKHMDIY